MRQLPRTNCIRKKKKEKRKKKKEKRIKKKERRDATAEVVKKQKQKLKLKKIKSQLLFSTIFAFHISRFTFFRYVHQEKRIGPAATTGDST